MRAQPVVQIEYLDASHYRLPVDLAEAYCDVKDLHGLYDAMAFQPHSNLVLVGPKGAGKAQPLDALVLTPDGFVPMGEITPGMKVVHQNGEAVEVLEIHPQGRKSVYRVIMTDGSETRCCDEHLWQTRTVNDAYHGRPPQVRSLGEIRETLVHQTGSATNPRLPHNYPAHRIPLACPVQFTPLERSLPLAPYLLGVLLGDGCFRSGSVQVSNSELDVMERALVLLPDGDGARRTPRSDTVVMTTIHRRGTRSHSHTRLALESMGLWGCKSLDKFIPEIYLRASISDRLDLLCGLCDTDGYVLRSGQRVEITTSSVRLAEGLLHLIRSLGGLVRMTNRIPTYTYLGERRQGARSYRLTPYFHSGLCPVRSAKHQARWKGVSTHYHRAIAAVEPDGEAVCQCITVDAEDGLYITDDFIVTHNSLSLAAWAAKNRHPIVTYSCSEDTNRQDLYGTFTLRNDRTPFILGPITTAFEIANAEGHCILCLEEINALKPGAQKLLNPICDFHRRVEVPTAHKVFELDPGAKLWVVGTMNTAVYGGVHALNEDLTSRLNLGVVSYPELDDERRLLEQTLPKILKKLTRTQINHALALAMETRQGEFEYALSTRDLVQMLTNIATLGVERAVWLASGKFEDEDRDTFLKRAQSHFGTAG